MATSARVRRDVDCEFHGRYLLKQVGGRVRVYEDASSYSSTSGGYTALGKVMRDADGKVISLPDFDSARSWIDKGCITWPKLLY